MSGRVVVFVLVVVFAAVRCEGQVLVGGAVSSGLGETNPGVLVGVEGQTSKVDGRVMWSSAGKLATGAGWSFGGEVLTTGRVLAGVDVRWRSGGPWHKQTVWAMGGVRFGVSRVLVAWPVYESHEDNVVRVVVRQRVGRVEWAPSFVHYRQPGGVGSWGVAADVVVRIGRVRS